MTKFWSSQTEETRRSAVQIRTTPLKQTSFSKKEAKTHPSSNHLKALASLKARITCNIPKKSRQALESPHRMWVATRC